MIVVPVTHDLIHLATVHTARLPLSLLDEVAEERGAWRKRHMIDVAVQGLVHSEHELSHTHFLSLHGTSARCRVNGRLLDTIRASRFPIKGCAQKGLTLTLTRGGPEHARSRRRACCTPSGAACSSAARPRGAHTPMSSFQMVGCSRMNRRIISVQRLSWSTSTPRNVTFSPTTTRGMRYSRIAPEHMAHGDKVVYKTLRAYTPAGRRPAFSKASISPWSIALAYCTRRLCPRPMICPSWTRTEPIGMPPSASPTAASETALSRNSSIDPPRQHAASPGRPQPFRGLNRHPMPPNA